MGLFSMYKKKNRNGGENIGMVVLDSVMVRTVYSFKDIIRNISILKCLKTTRAFL